MQLYLGNTKEKKLIAKKELLSIIYHDIFDYPLTQTELVKWSPKEGHASFHNIEIDKRHGFYFLKERKALVLKRLFRERVSVRKMNIAKKAAKILSLIPTIKMAAVTGALAMNNADEQSDIDLMAITSKKTLWTTRVFSWLLLKAFGFQIRKPGEKLEKDKLCLNIWLDESDVIWSKEKRNIFNAHEIAQIVPLVNKDNTYEKFLWGNRWLRRYWPNAVRMHRTDNIVYRIRKIGLVSSLFYVLCSMFEPLAFWLQRRYMKGKITREVVTPTKALFHPVNWSEIVKSRLKYY